MLERDGYHAFSTRRVAQECSISVGNLTYYFPTKDSLIEALMEAIYDRYQRRYTELRGAGSRGSPNWLADVVTAMLRDAVSDDATGLFLELWVMAKFHAFGAQVLDRFYERGVCTIAEEMSNEYTDLSKQELLPIAYLLVVLTDGLGAVFSRLGDRSVGHEEIISLAVEAIEGLLNRLHDGV